MMPTFKQYFDGDVAANANPFARRDKGGDTEWSNGDNTLTLVQKLGWHEDGVIRIKVKAGFMIKMKLSSEKWGTFASIANSFIAQGLPDGHIDHYNTGLGGDSVLTFKMWDGDFFDIYKPEAGNTGIDIQLRKSLEMHEAGSWRTEDFTLGHTADIEVTLLEVTRYAEKTGDYEGSQDEESGEFVPDPDDPFGVDDTPIDDDYHPSEDEDLELEEPSDYEASALMGTLYIVLLVTILAAMWGRKS